MWKWSRYTRLYFKWISCPQWRLDLALWDRPYLPCPPGVWVRGMAGRTWGRFWTSVLLGSNCQTKRHGWAAHTAKASFLPVPEAVRNKGVPAGQVLQRGLFCWCVDSQHLAASSCGLFCPPAGTSSLVTLLTRALIPFWAPTLTTSSNPGYPVLRHHHAGT